MLELLKPYWYEFVLMATAHLLAVISPGPDFAVVSKHAIRHGRRCAIYTSIGVGTAILLHIAYSLLGIALLLAQNPVVFDIFKYLAAAYLIYIGYGALRSGKPVEGTNTENSSHSEQHDTKNGETELSNLRSFGLGFLTNGLNPKATLFFLSLFTVIVSTETPMTVKVIYGVYMAIATAAWFSFLSMILTLSNVRNRLLAKGYLFDRLMGIILILLAIKLVFFRNLVLTLKNNLSFTDF